MLRKTRLVGAALLVTLSLAHVGARQASAITCNDDPPYAVFYTEGSGGGNRLVLCKSDTFGSLSSTFNDSISSVVVYGPLGSKVPCAYEYTTYQGRWAKFAVGQHGFTWFQWPYQTWSSGSNMDDQISSISWCNP
jgi:hypothetical protein